MLAWWIGIVRSVVAQRIRAIRQIRGSYQVLVLPLKKTLVAAERSEAALGTLRFPHGSLFPPITTGDSHQL